MLKWESTSPHLVVKPFADPQTKWREVSQANFLTALEHLGKHDGVEGVKHPTAKAVAGEWMAAKAVVDEHGDHEPWVPLLHQVMYESWQTRLGIKMDVAVPVVPESLKTMLPAAARDLILATSRKCKSRLQTTAAVLEALTEPANNNVVAASVDAAEAPEVDNTVAIEKTAAEVALPDAGAKKTPGRATDEQVFSVGDMVTTRAVKSKPDYHGHKAEVIAVLALGKKIRVKLLEGPKKNSPKEYECKYLSRLEVTNASDSAESAVAPAAGTDDELEKFRAERKRRAEENAARLFGKLPKL